MIAIHQLFTVFVSDIETYKEYENGKNINEGII